ncbi:MAG: RluA family pseudouridine synthase [Alphaproteobacteria bacterium]|nr:MAG: RluA family pseudouridine synthase [Alphaproteobacteria bacterium]
MSDQGVQTRIVEEKDDGMRLDRWFLQYFPNLKFGHLQKLLRGGQIRVDGGRVKSGTRLATGQTVRIPPLDSLAANPVRKSVKTAAYKLTDEDRILLSSFVLYEDDDVLAVNKPSGLASQGGSRQKRHLDGILAADAREKGIDRPHLVHRLDLETSGVCLVAKNAAVARKLGDAFRGHKLQKYYWAVCLGVPEEAEGEIVAPIAKQNVRGGEAMEVDPEFGKSARTVYAVADRLGNNAAWVVFSPLTGRTHQIRVHAAYMSCPLIGDTKYASLEEEERFQEVMQEEETPLHLHARRLVVPKSVLGRRALDITAPLPDHMRRTCKKFGFSEDAAMEEALL